MGLGGVAIAILPSIICLKLTFSDGLGGVRQQPNNIHLQALGVILFICIKIQSKMILLLDILQISSQR